MKALQVWALCLLCWLAQPSHAAETVRYIHTDALGSVVAVTDASGAVIERREYEPYGAQLTPAVADGPGYTGHVQDAATGLTYMQQRYYDPLLGVFLSVDPVTALGNPVGQFHRYRYANSNPYSFIDPDGREAKGGCGTRIPGHVSFGCISADIAQTSPPTNRNSPDNSVGEGRKSAPPRSAAGGRQAHSPEASAVAETVRNAIDGASTISGATQYSLVFDNRWRGANGRWYSLGWGGNQHAGARSYALREAYALRAIGQGLFFVSAGVSLFEGVGAYQAGDHFGMAKSGVDIGWGAAGAFGGPIGFAGGAAYFGTSLLIQVPGVEGVTVVPATDAMCWATGNC
ncbi:hypothetical protein H0E84_00375 [Luteimonas sp. SJ-92]|uniref:Teneurin-like YD-shell domain-containing protein n=1 Tax=Luteimonas salinisoli TaxID=2752307 RepID=A0A853J839_9GAMM|nr:RHS repeat-associated core domain-containing protein [Luteimonas salinisoli]NZA24830.1 hypothetical protein [Luteimonas salinisoli]